METVKKVYEEDIEAAVAVATEILGPQGRLLYGERSIVYNAKITTELHGTIWYGDIAMGELDRLNNLVERLGTGINVVTEGSVILEALPA